MHNPKKGKLLFYSNLGIKNHKKDIARTLLKKSKFNGHLKFIRDVKRKGGKLNITFPKNQVSPINQVKPNLPEILSYLKSKIDLLSLQPLPTKDNGYLYIPETFSLSSNESPISYFFLKRLFSLLYNSSVTKIILDYSKCQKIDVDASVCMDIIIGEFTLYFRELEKRKISNRLKAITPINYEKENINKILTSIGAFSNLKGVNIKYNDIIPYPLCIGNLKNPLASKRREVDITKMVDYVIDCLSKMNKQLTAESEDDLFKVIGEVLINAEEHSTGAKRFSIGYFQDSMDNGEHIGIFNLVILNFGNTIYEKFSDPHCPNKKVVSEMKNLSDRYTKNGFFTNAEFEEQTLWTLYALQEGVTSKADWKRGNGSIRFIESFFNLKGNSRHDDVSNLSIISGNTKIVFDGKHRLLDKPKGPKNKIFKMMTFNESGEIDEKPDKKYVTFVDNYFPGTIITARISINDINSEKQI
ncbi:hypothetical protein MCERE19_03161 [Spirosomataceae bacterium]